MSRSSLQKRSVLHHKRGFHLPRAGPAPAQAADANTPAKVAAPTPVVDQPKETTTTATPEKPVPVAPVALPPVLASTSTTSTLSTPSTSSAPSTSNTSSTPSTPSATAVPVTSSLPTSSLPTTHSFPTSISAGPRVVRTSARFSSSASASMRTESPSAGARATSGMNIIVMIVGVVGAILLTIIIGFVLRRWRKKKADENAFDASQFRRSAVLLDENDDNTRGRPRPPTMIERRNVALSAATTTSLPSPSVAYPYSDQPPIPSSAPLLDAQSFTQHGENQTQYRAIPLQPPSFAAGNQFNNDGGAPNASANPMHYQGDPFAAYAIPSRGQEQPGYGAPPVPGTHGPGAYAPYGADPRYPQSQRYPQYAQQQNQQHPQQFPQHGFSQGPAVDTASLTRRESVGNLPNPFSTPVPKNMEPTTGSGSGSESTPTSTSSASSSTGLTREASFVTRQSHEAPPPAYSNNEAYADMKRDVKVSPSTAPPPSARSSSLKVVNESSESAVPDTNAAGTSTASTGHVPESRPVSSYTLYNDDDAYGGM